MEAQQRINLDIVQRFAQEGIEFAFPTQTIQLAGDSNAGSPDNRPNARKQNPDGGG